MITRVLNSPASSSDMPQSSRRHFSLPPSPVLNSPASSSDMPQSSRRHFSPSPSPWPENQSSVTPYPASSRFTTPSPRCAVTPRSRFSPPLSLSESECPHYGDTIILSEDNASADFSLCQPLSFVSNPPPSLRRCEPIVCCPLSMLKSCQVVPLCQVTSIFSKTSPAHFAGGPVSNIVDTYLEQKEETT